MAGGVWLAGLVFVGEVVGLPSLAWWWLYGGMIATMVGVLFVFERVVLIERRAFTCRGCGYDLQGLTEARCPECGAAFDPKERARILARIAAAPPKTKYGAAAILLALVLAFAALVGMFVYFNFAGRGGAPAGGAAPTATQAATRAATQPGGGA